MANQFKSVWLVILLVASGVVIFFLTVAQNNSKPQTVVLQDIINPKATQAGNAAEMKDPVPSPAIVSEDRKSVV